jgi:hypothetical protein
MSPHHGIIGVTQETCMHSGHHYQRPKEEEEEDQAEESSVVEQGKGGSARGWRRRRLASSKPARQQHTAAALLPNGRGSQKIRVPSIRIKRGCNVMSADVGSEDTDGLPAAACSGGTRWS